MEITLHAPAIECDGCARSIKKALGKLAGIEHVDVDVARKDVTVRFDAEQTDAQTVAAALARAGFPAEPTGSA
ncbi:MAG: heavy-metal-associated domain-containing protein [Chthonomonadales bacterium]